MVNFPLSDEALLEIVDDIPNERLVPELIRRLKLRRGVPSSLVTAIRECENDGGCRATKVLEQFPPARETAGVPKFVQITSATNPHGADSVDLYALDIEGNVWVWMNGVNAGWHPMSSDRYK
jgi:hypothetical protein